MSYTALYRKFRPDTFEEVKGQDHIITTLKNQIRADRVGHAYLLCGTRGTGKTTIAKILARAVNCEHPVDGSPCNECAVCRAIRSGASLNVIEIDAASNNGVDNIREIREEVNYRPTEGRYKVYIIDEVHMLSAGAFNALLKTLEEPPEYVIFILATTEANKIPVTILSRCQRYDFHRITIDTIAGRLQDLMLREGISAEEKALRYVAKAGDGSMRDALSLLDQCIAFYLGEELTYDKVLQVLGTVDQEVFSRMLRLIHAGQTAETLRILDRLVMEGKEMTSFVNDFTWYLRNLLLVQKSDGAEDAVDASAETMAALKEESRLIDEETLMRYIHVLSELSGEIRFSAQKRILVEMALIRLCRPQMDTDLSGILDRIRVLEQKTEEALQREPVIRTVQVEASQPVEKAAAEKKKEVPKAAPEDLVEICREWPGIQHQCSPLLRAAKIRPQYDARSGGSCLYLAVEDNTALNLLRNEERQEEIKTAIRTITGKDTEIMPVLRGANDHVRDIDTAVRNQIMIDIEEED